MININLLNLVKSASGLCEGKTDTFPGVCRPIFASSGLVGHRNPDEEFSMAYGAGENPVFLF